MASTFSGAYLGPGPVGGRFLTPDEVELDRTPTLNRVIRHAFPDVWQQWLDGICSQALASTGLDPDEIAAFFTNARRQLQTLFDDWGRGENRDIHGFSIFRQETTDRRKPIWAMVIVRDATIEKLTTFRNGVFFPIDFLKF